MSVNNKNCLKPVIATGAGVNVKDYGKENTALTYKVLNGSLSLVKTFIFMGVNVDVENKYCVNALMNAARQRLRNV